MHVHPYMDAVRVASELNWRMQITRRTSDRLPTMHPQRDPDGNRGDGHDRP